MICLLFNRYANRRETMENQIQWYPGHMAKTRKMLDKNIRFVDVVVEILDARIPSSGRNPNFNDIIKGKSRLIVMNKYDLADKAVTDLWISEYQRQGMKVIPVSCQTGYGVNKIEAAARSLVKDKIDRETAKGITKPVKIMMVGIPNVGKSTLINRLVGKNKAIAADRPGVTRTEQWVRIKEGLDLLDTPGLLPPKFDDEEKAKNLVYTGAIKDEIMNIELLSYSFLELLRDIYPELLCTRYKITEDISELAGHEILSLIGKKRGFMISGGEIDTERAAYTVMDEFRSCKIGNITLERP